MGLSKDFRLATLTDDNKTLGVNGQHTADRPLKAIQVLLLNGTEFLQKPAEVAVGSWTVQFDVDGLGYAVGDSVFLIGVAIYDGHRPCDSVVWESYLELVAK